MFAFRLINAVFHVFIYSFLILQRILACKKYIKSTGAKRKKSTHFFHIAVLRVFLEPKMVFRPQKTKTGTRTFFSHFVGKKAREIDDKCLS